MKSMSTRPRTLVATLLALVATAGWAAPEAAVTRLKNALEATLSETAALRAERYRVEAERAEALARTGVGSPYLEYQQEGLGGSLEHELNAQDKVRVGLPFRMPWQISEARNLGRAAEQRAAIAARAIELDALAESGASWLESLALSEKLSIVRARLELFDRLLRIQEKRLELGELAGTEVTQLKLARASELAAEARLVADREASLANLEIYCGASCAAGELGDLESLASALVGEEDFGGPTMDELPLARLAASERELSEAWAEVSSQAARGYPELQLEWEHIPRLAGIDGYDAWGFQISLPLPFGRQVRGEIASASARAAEASEGERAAQRNLARRYSQARESLAAARAQLAALDPLAREHARHEHSLAEQFRLGAISYLAFLDGVARLDAVRLATIDARRELVRWRLELAALVDDPELMPARKPNPENAT